MLRSILGQARPIFVGHLAVMLYGVVDTVLTGHASALDLATMGLGASVYSTVFVSLLGALNALNPIIGQHWGGGRHRAIGASYVQGLWLAVLLSLAGGAVLAFPEPWLGRLHAPPEVGTRAGEDRPEFTRILLKRLCARLREAEAGAGTASAP